MADQHEWICEDTPSSAPTVVAPTDERALKILAGFRINWMNMADASTGEILWQDSEWGDLLTERDIHLPKRILQCRAVSREFQFSSVEMLQGLRLEQRIFLQGSCMEGTRRPTLSAGPGSHPRRWPAGPLAQARRPRAAARAHSLTRGWMCARARRVALPIWVCHPQLDEHVAADD